MKPLRLGFLSPLATLVTVAALAAVAAVVAVRGAGMFSPGALSAAEGEPLGGVRAHGELACARCHPAPWQGDVVSDRCAACHVEVTAELREQRPLHGALPGAAACLACHTEHLGPRGDLTIDSSVPHDDFGFSLRVHGRRADGAAFACADCHTESLEAYTCGGCHDEEDPRFEEEHVAAWGRECLACHDGVDRFSAGVFRHDRTDFRLTGRHRQVACVDCHEGARTLERFADAPGACVDCHPDPEEHRGQFGTACGDCHSTETWEGARFDHDFPLDHGSRRASPCKTCHPDAPDWDTYTCYGCHEHTPANIRAEHLEEGIRDYRDCVRCHPTGREEEAEDD